MIVLKNIYKSFGGQRVLEDLSLEIPDGGRVAVMGRSGAGKTTLINIIMGLVKPDGGEVSVPKGTAFGAVFQEDRLIEGLSQLQACRKGQIRRRKRGAERPRHHRRPCRKAGF